MEIEIKLYVRNGNSSQEVLLDEVLNTSMKDLVNKFRDVPRFDHL